MRVVVAVVVGLATLAAAASCRGRSDRRASSRAIPAIDAAGAPAIAAAGTRTPGTRPGAGSVRAAQVTDAYAVVLPPRADVAEVERAMRAVASARDLDATLLTLTPTEVVVTPALLAHFGRGFDDVEASALAAASAAVGIVVTGDAARVSDIAGGAAAMARAGAAAGRGWVVDQLTRETFTRAAFDRRRPEPLPLSSDRMTVFHLVADDDAGVFFESFGLERFGLPELYLRRVPRAFTDEVAEMFNAAAQVLIERGAIVRDGVLDVDLASLTTPPWPDRARAVHAAGGTGQVSFNVTWSVGDEADGPDAPPLLELTLPGGAGAERLSAARRAFFGLDPDQLRYGDADRLEAARKRAMTELARLATHFRRGVPELESLSVKAPFATDHGEREWMWVEVRTWRGRRLTGILTNQPVDIAGLKEGAEVEVQQAELFDYIHRRADGTTAGGESERVLDAED